MEISKLTSEKLLLLDLLKAQIWQESIDEIVLPKRLDDWNRLMDLAYTQLVVCFISKACLRHKDADSIPHDIAEEMKAILAENARIHEEHNKLIVELFDIFKSKGLSPILMKGQSLAQLYPEPELRQCGDIDIYFSSDEYESAKVHMMSVEDEISKRKKESFLHFNSMYKGVTVELHRHFSNMANPFYNKRFQKWTLEMLSEKQEKIMISNYEVRVPTPLFNLFFVFRHMWHHFEESGVSLRQLCDVMMLTHHYRDKIQESDLQVKLRNYSAVGHWQIVSNIFVDFLGMPNDRIVCCDKPKMNKSQRMLQILFDTTFNTGYFRQKADKKWIHRIDLHLSQFRRLMLLVPIAGWSSVWRYLRWTNSFPYRIALSLAGKVE